MASRRTASPIAVALLILWLLATGCRASTPSGQEEAADFLRHYAFPGEQIAVAEAELLPLLPDGTLHLQGDATHWLETIRHRQPDYLILPTDSRRSLLTHDPWFQRHYRLVRLLEAGTEEGESLYAAIPRPEETSAWQPATLSLRAPDGGEIELTAYRLSLLGEEATDLALRWCVGRDLTLSLALEVQMADAAGAILARDIAWPDRLHTERWAEGLCLTTEHRLPPLDTLPTGEYALRLVFDPPLVLVGEEGRTTPLTLTTLTRLPDVRFDPPPAPAHPMQATFGDTIGFLGYDAPLRLPVSSTLPIVLYWQAQAPVPMNAKVFIHLLTEGEERLVAQADGIPVRWQYPTGRWRQGEFICDRYRLDLTAVPRGNYQLVTGLYDPATGERLPLVGPEADTGKRYLLLGIVAIR